MQRQPLKPLDDALTQLLQYAKALTQQEVVNTFDADGRVLAQDIVSELQVPPQDNSSMDGYALRCADLSPGATELPVTQRIAAGSAGVALRPSSAARIFTGAPIPPGADAVIMQEDCEALPGERVRINATALPGQWIRRAGEDIASGSVILAQGERLSPAALGLAASVGMSTLTVLCRPRVALFSTGDELVMPGEIAPAQMKPGSIYNSNRFFLRALLQRLGCEVSDLGIVPDRLDATVQALQQAARGHDLILTSGGVSVGEEDHIKPAVQSLGSLDLWHLAIKPGKPFAYGRVQDAPFHRLAGQPGVELCYFLATGAPVSVAPAGCPSSGCPFDCRAGPFHTSQSGQATRISARKAQRAGRTGLISQPEFRCPDLGGLGRWPGGQPAGASHCSW